MSKKNLTDAGVKNQKPPKEGQEEHFDLRLPGFALRVSEQGTKSWIVFYRIGGKQRRLTLGRYPALKLSDARKEARAALDQVDLGIDPAEEKKLKKRKALEQPNNFEGVAELFIERYAKKKKRTWAEDERVFKKYVTPYWGHRPLDTITRSDVVALLDQVEDDHGPYMANRVLATIRKLLNWALAERALIEVTPIVPGMSRGKEVKRNRVLDDDELKAVWNAADEIGWPFGPFLRVLILTGQRRNEVAGMRWDELDLEAGLWTLPAERNKSERIFEVPLSDMAADIFKNSPRIGDYVFTSGRIPKTGDGKPRPISGYSKFISDST